MTLKGPCKTFALNRDASLRHIFSLLEWMSKSQLLRYWIIQRARGLITPLEVLHGARWLAAFLVHAGVSVSLTDAGRRCCVPLSKGTWHSLAVDSTGSLQQISWTALKSNHRAGWELWTDPPAVPWLWHWAALTVTGARHSCNNNNN